MPPCALVLFEGHLCEACIFKSFLAAKVLTFRVVTNRNLTLPMQTLSSSKTQKHFNLSVKKKGVVLPRKMKVEAGATNKSDSVLRLRWGERQGQLGSGPRGQAQALSRVLKAGAAAGTPGPGWVPGVVVTRPACFLLSVEALWEEIVGGCGVEAGKPSNPFSFMRPFLGSRPATSDLSLLFVCAGES